MTGSPLLFPVLFSRVFSQNVEENVAACTACLFLVNPFSFVE